MMSKEKFKVGDVCSHCKKGKLIFIPEVFPYAPDHLQCAKCDSTYCLSCEFSDIKKDALDKGIYEFSGILKAALARGIKEEEMAKVAMTPIYNVKRWIKGSHCPPEFVRKTLIEWLEI